MAARTTTTEEQLPSREEAYAAFIPALAARQSRIRQALEQIATEPPQVLILEGGDVAERFGVALWYGARLNCGADGARPCLECASCLQIGAGIFHDLYILDGRAGGIKIETVRELRPILSEPPRGDGKRVVILAEAQALGVEAANALLKSLEEPRPGVCFVMSAPQRERLLPTLVSRGWVLTLAWPEMDTPLSASMREWEEALVCFMRSGQGWFERTSGKGAVDAGTAQAIIAMVRKSLALTLSGRGENGLSRELGLLPEAGLVHISDILSHGQESLEYMVNPALMLDWMATRMHMASRRARMLSGGRRPT